ncbi:MAG: lipopolysaccharide biosynthesis protein, partial [Atribacterota bacterium]
MFNNIKQKIKNNIGKDIYEFLSHSKNYVTADVVSKGLAFISIPIFTRLLVPSEYGILAVFTSFVGFFSIVYGLGVRTGVTIYYFEKTDDFDEFYGSNILLIIVWGLLLSGVLYFLRNYVQRFFKIPLLLIYLGIGVTFSKSIFQLYKSYLQASKQSKKIAKLTIIRAVGIIVIGIIITLLLKDDKFYGKATAKLIMSFLFLIISLKAILSISKVKFEKKYLKYSLILGLPIVLHLISSRILKTFDQIIINQLVGPGETGLYSFAFKIGMILNIIAMGLQRAWSPMLYERLNQKKYKDIE